MLAAEGRLPLAHSVAAASEVGRRHRFGWQECAELARAPRLLFSAACGSGTSHVVGIGEQVGFYSVLRPAGLRAMVAPRWDVVAGEVLPVLRQARELHLSGHLGLAASVHAARRSAVDSGTPGWSAYALAVEGDWR